MVECLANMKHKHKLRIMTLLVSTYSFNLAATAHLGDSYMADAACVSNANAALSAFLAVCFNCGDDGEGGKRTRGAVLCPSRLAGSLAGQPTRKNHKHE